MNALILVDIQNDFVPGGALPVPEGDQIVPVVNQLQPRFDLVVATQDWHPANHGSFAANHADRKPGELIDLHGLPQILWPTHCVQGTTGAEFVPGLQRDRWDRVFVKGTHPDVDSYSGFYDNARRQATGLGDYLKQKGVDRVYIAGLATDHCVKATALDALNIGFETYLVEDACRGVNLQPNDVREAINAMKSAGARIVQAGEIIENGPR
jgi:nicotinamidase/pyrazinamidase